MRSMILLATVLSIANCAQTSLAVEPDPTVEIFWVLLHEPAVTEELGLSSDQQQAYQQRLDGLDLRFFPLRGKPPLELQAALAKLNAEFSQELKTLLKPNQSKRLNQILLWRIGISSLLRDDVAARMKYSETQRKRIKTILDDTQTAVSAMEKQIKDGQPREPLEKEYTDLKTKEQVQIVKLLKPAQQATWKEILGEPFAVANLGVAVYKVPELIDSHEWINSKPLSLEKLRGKVVVVHFYACGCINCIHNYPWYHEWSERFKGQDVVMIGIHTPETTAERDVAHVRQKAAAEKFTFPVLVDVKSENWNAWGNSMWPCVYVIDQRGYLRCYWAGELKWKGSDGEKYIRQRIEELLLEPKP